MIVGIVVVVLGIALIATWKAPQPSDSTSGPAATYAPQGQLTPQFPKELVLDTSATIDQSYSLNYASDTNQYTADWASDNAPNNVLNDYQTYFTSAGWTISASPTGDPNIQGLSASTSTGYALVTITPQGTGSQVTVTYVAAQQ